MRSTVAVIQSFSSTACTDMLNRLISIYCRDFQVILFDHRGAGRTDCPDEGYTNAHMADDLEDYWMRLALLRLTFMEPPWAA